MPQNIDNFRAWLAGKISPSDSAGLQTMSLFQRGDFTLHSGSQSQWKIECDALTDEDWETLGLILRDMLPMYGAVEGVPRGGLKLAGVMQQWVVKGCDTTLIVDDVLTSGGSMETHRAGRRAVGAVVFARRKCPDWIVPMFVLQMP